MPDSYKVVSTKGLGSRLGDSIKGIVVGFLMVIGSFGLIYWNEGRTDMSSVAKTATQIKADDASAASANQGKLISASGILSTNERIGDENFLLPGDYIAVKRSVETYAWVEKSETKSSTNAGGSETSETTYTYSQDWVSKPADSSSFQAKEGHVNPAPVYTDNEYRTPSAQVGSYKIAPADVELPAFQTLVVNDKNSVLGGRSKIVNNGQYIFISANGRTTIEQPAVGDTRVSYSYVANNQNGVVFGKANGNLIEPFITEKGDRLYRFFTGTYDEAIVSLHGEYVTSLWAFRLLGLILMWLGLFMMLGPISTTLDIIPFLGSLSRGLIGVVTFLIALVVSIVTILVSMILHNVIAILVTALVVLIAGVYIIPRFFKKQAQA